MENKYKYKTFKRIFSYYIQLYKHPEEYNAETYSIISFCYVF